MPSSTSGARNMDVTTGVADYFAVLGVGNELIWKHTQKQSPLGDEAVVEDSPEELEARFYREIVHVSLLVVQPSQQTSNTTDSSIASSSLPGTSTQQQSSIPQVASYTSDNSSQVVDSVSRLPSSPSHSEATTEVPKQFPPSASVHDGWTVVSRTLPAATPGHVLLETEGPVPRKGPSLWSADATFEANLNRDEGLREELLSRQAKTLASANPDGLHLAALRRKMGALYNRRRTRQQRSGEPSFFLSYLRRGQLSDDSRDRKPAVADVQLFYVRVPRDCLELQDDDGGIRPLSLASQLWQRYQSQARMPTPEEKARDQVLDVLDFVELPPGADEWIVPHEYRYIRDLRRNPRSVASSATIVLEPDEAGKSFGVEAMDRGPLDAADLEPRLVSIIDEADEEQFSYIPILAIRRQRLGDEERFHEDSAAVELAVSFCDGSGKVVQPNPLSVDDEEEEEESGFSLLGLTPWSSNVERPGAGKLSAMLGAPVVLVRRNRPFGFCDATFATKVHARFPLKNYKDLPLPEEELPMFCYPTGCRLHRACFSDAPLPQYYGFVVKNERGDSIYVSCVSFMEPLTPDKLTQLATLSERRSHASLAHRNFCEDRDRRKKSLYLDSVGSTVSTEVTVNSSCVLTGFDEMVTFENKTICVVSRYPFWTSFRKFLSHLHTLSTSSYEIPLERYISHLLLSVPIPEPGGPNVIVALPAGDPMILNLPAEKDFPLVDLPFERLMACLDIKTIVMIVLGILALERKVIILSTRPSLVLDVCELLRSLLFPFDLCAPYVPRLTEPFKSSLEFPGAIFVGIHDDGTPDGLAASVRKDLPEDSIIVDLDNGEIDCDGDKHLLIATAWDIIPEVPRSALVSELQILCRDAAIVDGQEPLDSQYDSAFDVSLTDAVDDFGIGDQSREPLDDRAVRDSFFRFFCAVLGGYDSFLVAPDADFLVSGNEWFDSQGFLDSVSSSRSAYLSAFVGTQLFQAFIQRRTEASDARCVLFDECLSTYHRNAKPYGRLGDDVETVMGEIKGEPPMVYSLLVDQAAALVSLPDHRILPNESMDASDAESSFSHGNFSASIKYAESLVQPSGDIITSATAEGLPPGRHYMYCVDGNPCFPLEMKLELLLPKEPVSWSLEIPKAPNPLLARSGRELEEAERQRRKATSSRGLQQQRRCMWQLPKLMGSHVLGVWLLCIPARVGMGDLSHEQQSKYFLQALGAIRSLRSKQRIVPDEAGYRALMAACGRTQSDRRVELVKLWGLLRSDGIFPSAVTLGQYTRALAEGYSKRLSAPEADFSGHGQDLAESSSRVGRLSVASLNIKGSADHDTSISAMDGYLVDLESHGRRWRYKSVEKQGGRVVDEKKKRSTRPWLPVMFSSSFRPVDQHDRHNIRLVAMWSRTQACKNCGYIALDEEIQAGWDVVGEEIPGAVSCAKCGAVIVPLLAHRELSVEEALDIENCEQGTEVGPTGGLPPQIRPTIDSCDAETSFVNYISPAKLRLALELRLEANGEECLVRDHLREEDPELFYNLWWYCARFSLPLPLPVVRHGEMDPAHYCGFASWDKSAALRGCISGAKAFVPLVMGHGLSHDGSVRSGEIAPIDPFDDIPILSRYNLQGFNSNVWDHADLSKILVALVEACDKRDFRPVVENTVKAKMERSSSAYAAEIQGSNDGPMELDVYRTILYLAKYQCTSAFHSFFPATLKACKGYHFWCPQGRPVPPFDRLLREAVQRLNSSKEQQVFAPVHEISDVALGFRSVFGHLI